MLERQVYTRQPELASSGQVIYAGASERRIACLQQLRIDGRLTLVPLPLEPTGSTLEVARFKIKHALDQGVNTGLVIAADTQTYLQLEDESFSPRVKPRGLGEILANFQTIAASGTYEVQSASVACQPPKKTYYADLLGCRVQLSAVGIQHLLTEGGFDEYQKGVLGFYSHPVYTGSGLSPETPCGFSAGFSLPVLARMSLVESVNGQPLDPKQPSHLTAILKQALYTVAIGFSPKLLRLINPAADRLIDEWPWLNQAVMAVTEEMC